MSEKTYSQNHYKQPLFYCPYCCPANPYVCPYSNENRVDGPIKPIKPFTETTPFKIGEALSALDAPRKTIEAKWKALGGKPGAAVSGLERVGPGYRIRYQNGAIYTKRPSGPAWWVYGAIGERYNVLRGAESWLGFPVTDELPLKYDDGRVSGFEHGEIYWWPDTGAIEIDKVVLTYKGIHCFGKTDGPGSDQVYASMGVVAPTGKSGDPVQVGTALTRLYTGVNNRQSVPDHIELYRGKPYGLNITFVLMEHDQGDPNAYYGAVVSSVKAAAGALTAGIGAATGPATAAIAGPVLQGLVPVVSKQVNSLLGTGDDLIGNITIPLTVKQVILLAARTGESTFKQLRFKLETPLLTGDGASYKGYFTFDRA